MAPNMEMDTEDQKVKALLENYPDYFEVLAGRNKIVCKLTKHELPLNATALKTYINGKKFQSFFKKVKTPTVIQKIDNKYKEYFIPSKKSPSRLFCTLTRKEINKLPHEIERYITGYKFLKAVDRDRERKKNGIENTEIVDEEKEEEPESGDAEMDEMGEEDEVPFFALSSEDEGEESDGDEELKGDDDITLETVPNDTELEEKNIKNNVFDEVDENSMDGAIVKGQKRKTKIKRLKKDKKSKRLKPGV